MLFDLDDLVIDADPSHKAKADGRELDELQELKAARDLFRGYLRREIGRLQKCDHLALAHLVEERDDALAKAIRQNQEPLADQVLKVLMKGERALTDSQHGYREILDAKDHGEGYMSIDHLIEELDCYSETDFSVYQTHDSESYYD